MNKQEKKKLFDYLNKYKDFIYINDIFIVANNNQFIKEKTYSNIYIYCLLYINIFISVFLIIFNLPYKITNTDNKEIAITRVLREKQKIENINKNLFFIGDDIKRADFTMYRIGKINRRLKFLLFLYWRNCIKDYKIIKKIIDEAPINFYKSGIMLWFVERIPHAVIYKESIDNLLFDYNLNNIYIGATHERFALIVQEKAKMYNKNLICIPHGLETAEKMPGGYIGDIFFCSSIEMADKLNLLYSTKKFIHDYKISQKMYYRPVKINSYEKKIVFFTQPIYTEVTKKIIRDIALFLNNNNLLLYLKIHPNEKVNDYLFENTYILDDIDQAIVGNVCISVLSTVLVEAKYNNSHPISIIRLVCDLDDLTGDYEFLNDKEICKPENKKQLLDIIMKEIEC